MNKSEADSRFVSFSQAASYHAWERYRKRLDNSSIPIIDMILKSESETCDVDSRASLILCYGSWVGEWMIQNFQGTWVGKNEPTSPRVSVGGELYSPMDAVERLLTSDSARSLESLIGMLIIDRQHADNDVALVTQKNRLAWDAMISDERFVRTDQFPSDRVQALEALDPWLRSELLSNEDSTPRNVLCLAAGGGTHGPLIAIAGACVTVVDFSDRQLAIDRAIASRLGLTLETVDASIDDLSKLDSQSFDIVIQPVSMCYIRDTLPVYQEVARVIRPRGLYLAQHKQPASLQANLEWTEGLGYAIATPAEDGRKAPNASGQSMVREHGTTEFIHSYEALLGGLCRSGFLIEDLSEPPRGDAWASENSYAHRCRFLPPYIKVKARRH